MAVVVLHHGTESVFSLSLLSVQLGEYPNCERKDINLITSTYVVTFTMHVSCKETHFRLPRG
jgi:hypothetical protein